MGSTSSWTRVTVLPVASSARRFSRAPRIPVRGGSRAAGRLAPPPARRAANPLLPWAMAKFSSLSNGLARVAGLQPRLQHALGPQPLGVARPSQADLGFDLGAGRVEVGQATLVGLARCDRLLEVVDGHQARRGIV